MIALASSRCLGADTAVRGWIPEGRILFCSNHGQPFFRNWHAFTVGVHGGAPEALGLGQVNHLAFGPGGTLMYHSDSRGPWVDVYDLDPATGEARNRRRFRDLDEATGRPDGGACDVDGCYWSAGISAGRLNRFAPNGTLLDWIDLPVSRPTMPCFGGPDGMTLYVTSLSSGFTAEDFDRAPLSGQVIALPAPVRGVAVERFKDV